MSAVALLLDLDGVLVQPRGYRAAVQAAFLHLTRRWGWSLTPPSDDLLSFFEAHGIISEWDMVPLLLASALDGWVACTGRVPPPEVLTADATLAPPPPDYDARTPITRLAVHLRPDEYPVETALRLQRQGKDAAPFPHLGESPLLVTLLSDSREVTQSPTTRLFQQFTLGSAAFARVYGLPPALETPSLLQEHDRPLLSPENRGRLMQAVQRVVPAVAVYTARPSGPPRAVRPAPNGYAPEAELALAILGLDDLPLIGYGRLVWFAEREGLPLDESLMKPAPMHALSALLAAWLGDEVEALSRAWALLRGDRDALDGLPPFPWHVYALDDTAQGLRGVLAAVDALVRLGLDVTCHPLGVGTNPEKTAALSALGALVFPDVNAALTLVWQAVACCGDYS